MKHETSLPTLHLYLLLQVNGTRSTYQSMISQGRIAISSLDCMLCKWSSSEAVKMWVWLAAVCRWEPQRAVLRSWEKPACWRRNCSSSSDMHLLPGTDLWAGVGICFTSWFTTVLSEMMLLLLSPDCYMFLLHNNLRSFLQIQPL